MPKIAYEPCTMREKSLAVVEKANEIIAEYEADGYDLTLRQLYYQFVSRDLLANKVEEYKRLGDIISKARRAGLIDWDAIVDRTRNLRGFTSWDSPQDIVDACAQQYRIDLWRRQDWRVEVWFEKDALLGVFERACQEYRVPYFSCRGYASDSEVHAAAKRLQRCGKRVLILHFGDHDPSGIDMSRDIEDRLQLFKSGRSVEIRRLALTMAQVEEYNPPPNPAKESDSRFEGYQQKYGDESWELDALDPRTLAELVERHVRLVVDPVKWDDDRRREQEAKDGLRSVARRLPELLAMPVESHVMLTTGVGCPKLDDAINRGDGEAWVSIVFLSDGDLLTRDVGFDGPTPFVKHPETGDVWRYDDAEALEVALGLEVWADLDAFRKAAKWNTADVIMALLTASQEDTP